MQRSCVFLPECLWECMSGWGTLPLPTTVKPKPVDKVIKEATVKDVRVNGTKMKIWKRTGLFEQ